MGSGVIFAGHPGAKMTPDPISLRHALDLRTRSRIAAFVHVGHVRLGGGDDRLRQFRVLVNEGWDEPIEEPEHVGADEDLSVALGPGADADRRDVDAARHYAREL